MPKVVSYTLNMHVLVHLLLHCQHVYQAASLCHLETNRKTTMGGLTCDPKT